MSESKKLEWKAILTKEVKAEIVSFLNSSDGIIKIGVDNSGIVKGVKPNLKDEYEQTISNWIREGIYPNAKSFIDFYYDDDSILNIVIKEGKEKPYYISGNGPTPEGVYIRIGSTKRKATKEEIISLLRKYNDGQFENEESEIQDLHFTQFLSICEREKFKPKMNVLGFYTDNGKFSRLAYLLSDENEYIVKFAVYKDKTRVEFKIKKDFTGSYLRIVENVLDYAQLFNDTSAKIVTNQPKRVELESFPSPSLREALLNAFCHCDFSAKSNIKIEFFIDRVEITSPGNIYGGYTLQEILKGKQSMRNPRLISLLYKMDYVENYATGLERIIEAYNFYKQVVDFDVTPNFFRITLPNLNYHLGQKVENDVTKMSPISHQLSNLQKKIIEQMKKDNNTTIEAIADSTGKVKRTIIRNIKILKDLRIVARDESKHSGGWIILTDEF